MRVLEWVVVCGSVLAVCGVMGMILKYIGVYRFWFLNIC